MPRPRILVIDDEPGMLRAVSRILDADHSVTTAASPEAGIKIASAVPPDLVICDISMPRIDGFELLRRLKEVQPDVDFILMTGMSDPDAHLVRAIREQAFYFIEKPFNREVMRTLVDRCLELRRLRHAEHQHLGRIERELAEARALQETMLPPERAVTGGIEIAARCRACSELGGDIYDYAAIGDDSAAVLVADVVGHGVSAALLTTLVKAAFWSSLSDAEFDPRAVVRRASDGIRSFSDRRFITLACARIDRGAGRISYVAAGHPPALLRSADGRIELLDSTGPLISPAIQDVQGDQLDRPFDPSCTLLLYTDGIVEAGGESGPFSRQPLLDVMESNRRNCDSLLDAVLAAVATHTAGRPQHDDFTLLAARWAR
jgi:sigma-B regulation protein RsbU (phosphoserine phosphatase)